MSDTAGALAMTATMTHLAGDADFAALLADEEARRKRIENERKYLALQKENDEAALALVEEKKTGLALKLKLKQGQEEAAAMEQVSRVACASHERGRTSGGCVAAMVH